MIEGNKVAVIGGSGFVGSRLCQLLDGNGILTEIYDKNTSPIFPNKTTLCDVANIHTLDCLEGVHTIVNLAAVHSDDVKSWEPYFEANVLGAENICVIARKLNIKNIIFTSSVAIYGFAPSNTDESGDPDYFNDYGKSKYLAEKIYKKWYEESPEERSLVIIRPTVIFGEGNRGNVYNLFNQINSGRFLMVGSGCNTKSMAYVGNVSEFIKYCLSKSVGLHVYNYVDTPELDMNSLVGIARQTCLGARGVGPRIPSSLGLLLGRLCDMFSRILSISLPISYIRVQKFLATTTFSSQKMLNEFVPPYDMIEAVTKTLEYEFVCDNSDKPTFDTE